MPTYPRPWHPFVEITALGRHGIEQRETRKILLGTHTGTHCDASRHFLPDAQSVDQIPLDTLVGPAVVANFTSAGQLQELGIEHFERQLGNRRAERLILRFDWSKHWGTMRFFTSHPFVSLAAAEWLVSQGMRLLAMDTPSPDDPRNCAGSEPDSPIHKILLGNGVVLVEYLCNLNSLTMTDIDLIVLPLRIVAADGSPVRCVAIEHDDA